jgi:DNA-binding NtrC family response regulator
MVAPKAPAGAGARFLAGNAAMRQLLRTARRYAAVDANVLITGETGVGKDALARVLHASGPRRREPFVTIDCPGLPSSLVESELFGHERGAFTDATTARAGRFEMAGRGTVYLDAVTGLRTTAQGALLRVVEQRQVTRLGGTTAIQVQARVISSAEASITEAVSEGTFRTDLFHRLSVLPLHLPPLRERQDEVLMFAQHFLEEISTRLQRPMPRLSPAAQDALLRYRWPGNVRELRHVLERALLSGAGDVLDAGDLPLDLLERDEAYLAPAGRKRPTLEEVERRYIELTLQYAKGNQTKAAAILGISRKALWEKRKRFGLQ